MRSSMKTLVEMPTKLNEKITEKDIMILTKSAHSSREKNWSNNNNWSFNRPIKIE